MDSDPPDETFEDALFEADPDLEGFRFEVQEDAYDLLDEWVYEARTSIMALREARTSLLDALVYGNYDQRYRAAKFLGEIVESAMEGLLRVTGQFDSPAQVHAGLQSRTIGYGRRANLFAKLDGLDGPARERVKQAILRIIDAAVKDAQEEKTEPASLNGSKVEGTPDGPAR